MAIGIDPTVDFACKRVHLFELPKYVPASDNRVIHDPIEQWLYFSAGPRSRLRRN